MNSHWKQPKSHHCILIAHLAGQGRPDLLWPIFGRTAEAATEAHPLDTALGFLRRNGDSP